MDWFADAPIAFPTRTCDPQIMPHVHNAILGFAPILAQSSGPMLLLVLLVVGVVVVSLVWTRDRSLTILNDWARENGFRILSSERRYLRRGPFWWRTGKGQEVFYVTVEEETGEIRSGYVRCGSYFAGLLSSRADVEWDD